MDDSAALATVLIVDDTPANLGVVVEFLEDNNLRVLVAQDGKEGLKRAALVQPNLILLDVMMPGMDGFEVCKQLKANIATRDIPVIFMTALADVNDKLKGFKFGGVDYLTKPLQLDEMLARVNTHIALRAMFERLERQNKKLQHEGAARRQVESTLLETTEELKSVYKRLEKAKIQLLDSAKMAAIGKFVTGMVKGISLPLENTVHQLHQLELGLASYVSPATLEASKNQGTPISSDDSLKNLQCKLAEAKAGLDQIEEVVDVLGDFVETKECNWKLASVTHTLDTALKIVLKDLEPKAKVNTSYRDLPSIECLPAQLNLVFMNVLMNAAQAISEIGEICIDAGVAAEEIWVDISDSGGGIAPEHMPKIFDPFFTTKPAGKGTGLGLSLSFAVIKKHHGRIEVKDTSPLGTTFRIWLPLRQPSSRSERQA